MENNALQVKYAAAYEKIKAAQNIILITHERPDGDGLASLGALSVFLETLGKNHLLYCADRAPDFFSFLPQINKLTTKIPLSGGSQIPKTRGVAGGRGGFSDFDLIIVLDCGCLARTGLAEEIKNRGHNQFVIEFDHHPRVDDYADLEIRALKSSTAEVLYHFFALNNLKIDKNIANCLLTGILTDTGNLLFDSVTEETVRISSALLLRGATFPKITQKTLRNKSLGAMKIWGKILDNLKVNEKYNLAYSILTFAEIENLKNEYGGENMLDAATDILNNVHGVKAVLFLREEEPGKIRGSLRTKDPKIDVSRLAAALGGGGHPKASAFRLAGNIIKIENGWKIK